MYLNASLAIGDLAWSNSLMTSIGGIGEGSGGMLSLELSPVGELGGSLSAPVGQITISSSG